MVEQFCIKFLSVTNELPNFFAGQQIRAICHLKLKEQIKARDIKLKLIGRAKVSWKILEATTVTFTNGDGGSDSDTSFRTKRYKSEQFYLNQCCILWSSPEQKLAAGDYQFPINFTIPPDAAPSFIGKHGVIYYYCSVIIDRPWKKDKIVECPFFVIPILDLNLQAAALYPIEIETHRKVGFFRSGLIIAKLRIPQSGFVPGEEIPIQIEVENNSTKTVKKVKVKLLETVTFMAKLEGPGDFNLSWFSSSSSKFADFQQNVTTCKIDCFKEKFTVKSKSKDTFNGTMVVPNCTANFANCSIIRLEYSLEICLNVGNLKFAAPILIGTIPIRQNCPQIQNVAGSQSQPSIGLLPLPPPPTYEEIKEG